MTLGVVFAYRQQASFPRTQESIEPESKLQATLCKWTTGCDNPSIFLSIAIDCSPVYRQRNGRPCAAPVLLDTPPPYPKEFL